MSTSYFRARSPFRRRTVVSDQAGGRSSHPITDGYELPSPTFDQPMPAMAPIVAEELRAVSPYSAPLRARPLPDPVEVARANYETATPTDTKGRILQALTNAGLGFLQGAANNPNDPLAAGIGGAAAGGVISGVSPKTGRGMQFEMIERPRIEGQMRRDEARMQKARQAQMDALKTQETLTDIDLKRSQAEKNRQQQPPPRAESPFRRVEGGILDTRTGEIRPIAESPKQPAAHWARDEKGRFVNLNAPENQGKTIKGYDRPRAAPKPKEAPKVVSRSEVRRAATENNISESDAAAAFVSKGYRIVQ